MFQPKASKRESIDNSDITMDEFHTVQRTDEHWAGDYIQFGSFDPGVVNFGVRVERRYHSGPNAGKIVTLLYERVKPVTISPNTQYRTRYSSMTEYLHSHHDILSDCHVFIIERQMAINYQSVRIQQHVQSYLMTTYKNSSRLPIIIEVDAKAKLHKLGCPSCFNKNGYKNWSVEKAIDLLTSRNDTYALNIINKSTKKDDLADVVCQIEAVCIIFGFILTTSLPKPTTLTDSTNQPSTCFPVLEIIQPN